MAKKKVESTTVIRSVELIKLYQEIFSSENGEQVLFDLMKSTLFFQTTFDPNPTTAAFNEGRRSVVSDILAQMQKNPEEIYASIKKQRDLEKMYMDRN